MTEKRACGNGEPRRFPPQGGSWLVQPGETDLAAIATRARRAANLAGDQ